MSSALVLVLLLARAAADPAPAPVTALERLPALKTRQGQLKRVTAPVLKVALTLPAGHEVTIHDQQDDRLTEVAFVITGPPGKPQGLTVVGFDGTIRGTYPELFGIGSPALGVAILRASDGRRHRLLDLRTGADVTPTTTLDGAPLPPERIIDVAFRGDTAYFFALRADGGLAAGAWQRGGPSVDLRHRLPIVHPQMGRIGGLVDDDGFLPDAVRLPTQTCDLRTGVCTPGRRVVAPRVSAGGAGTVAPARPDRRRRCTLMTATAAGEAVWLCDEVSTPQFLVKDTAAAEILRVELPPAAIEGGDVVIEKPSFTETRQDVALAWVGAAGAVHRAERLVPMGYARERDRFMAHDGTQLWWVDLDGGERTRLGPTGCPTALVVAQHSGARAVLACMASANPFDSAPPRTVEVIDRDKRARASLPMTNPILVAAGRVVAGRAPDAPATVVLVDLDATFR